MEKHMEKVHKLGYDMEKVMELGMEKVMEIGFEMEFYGLLSEKQRKLAYELLIQYGNNINFSNFNSSVTVTGPTNSTVVTGPTTTNSTVVPGSSMEDSTVPNTVTEENTTTTTKDIIKDNIEMTNDTLSNTSTSTDIITDITDNYITDNYTTDTNYTTDNYTTVHMNGTIDMNNTVDNLNDEMKIYNYITQQVFLYDPQLYKSSVTVSGITVLGHTDSTTHSTSPTMSSTNNTTKVSTNTSNNTTKVSTNTSNNTTKVSTNTSNTNSNKDIGTVGASTVTEGKGANFTAMECTTSNTTEDTTNSTKVTSTTGTVGPSTVTDTVTEYIQMDSVGFGMGMACLQVTFGCINISEARYLHDQLIPLAPIFLSLSSATVGFRGELSNIDNRWPVLVQAMDDLDEHTRPYIIKGRYNTTSLYIQNSQFLIQNYLYLNDIQVASDSISYINLIKSGVDPILSRYISHELIYDPLIVYKEDFDSIDCNYTDMHYQVFHTTNWNTVRFNHPSITVLAPTASNSTNNSTEDISSTTSTIGASTVTEGKGANFTAMECTPGKGANSMGMECTMGKGADFTAMECTLGKGADFTAMECTSTNGTSSIGTGCKGVSEGIGAVGPSTVTDTVTEKNLPWRIEFRPMDIQMTDEENIMFISVLSYLVKVILKLKLNLYMPISLVDFNIQLASNIKSCYQQSFYFPKHINTFNQEIIMVRYNLYEILYGKIGLFRIVLEYLEEEYINEIISNEFYNEMKLYLQHFKLLTLGKLPTNATKQRQFIISHPSYQHDGIIHHDILYDLINQFTCQ
ncbi:glutamate-cysteine ligase, putative [Theileria annulata]|uniref:Glutamate--cysteine ligase n=1 Tax=Theileria annulata TaxID=5874 RepID=Q4UCX9_THEAN|nr:glutamate-cysteine ligase, putative [Theileria annulata]CAI75322.1 glutamate-cysteine ligase, putative [Theileria annulata]|eukprot:XP_954798.1 glutamate-cysteine ligase, putative [Theileria annulata]